MAASDSTQSRLTAEILRAYSEAALINAGELAQEASLLVEHGHRARAYFLAVASIEETGKALLAFDAQGRNLADSAVTSMLKRAMEDHSQKITAAFTGWLRASSNLRDAAVSAIHLMIHLRRGREPSMYTDIHPDGSTIQIPSDLVRDRAARDCIRLATNCLAYARRLILEKTPEPKTRAEDQLFSMKKGEFQKILNTEDFWWYYISQLEAGQKDFSEAVIQYRAEYVLKGVQFRPSSP